VTKQEQFLFIVYTATLANGISLSAQADIEKYKADFLASGVLGLLDYAIYASDRIPANKSAYEAAHEFCNYMFKNLEAANKANVPLWFARG
jgi:hypothetical protein